MTELDSGSSKVRVNALMSLLRLSRPDLPRLKELAERAQPLSPSQVQALHDVVTHVFLTGEPYEQTDRGFLGMGMAPVMDPDDVNGGDGRGVIVQTRMPGLAAYSALLEGDVILQFTERPGVWLSNPMRLVNVVGQFRPGDTLHIVLLRQGRQLTVPITLSARPTEETLSNLEEFDTNRLKVAEEYWEANFESMARPAYSQAD